MRKRRPWTIQALLALLLLSGCLFGRGTPSPDPTPTEIVQPVLPTATAQATAAPTVTPPQPTATTDPTPPPLQLPPQPDKGPLPALWYEITVGQERPLNPLYPRDVAVDTDSGWAYVLASCELDSLHESGNPVACIARYDLHAERLLDVALIPGGDRYGNLLIVGDRLTLHHPGNGALYVLDRETLAVLETHSSVHGIGADSRGRTYIVQSGLLTRRDVSSPGLPIALKYDDAPVAIAADDRQVYVLGYDALDVVTVDLEPVVRIPLGDGQLPAMALDETRNRLYVVTYDGLYVLDTVTNELEKTPADLHSAREAQLSADGRTLYVFAYLPGWFAGTRLAAVDTQTWEVTTLYQALEGQFSALAIAPDGEGVLALSLLDHALLPVSPTGALSPRLPVGLEVVDAVVDAANDRIYATDSAGWVHVLDRQTYAQRGQVYAGRELSLDATRGRLYVGDARQPEVSVLDTDSLEVLHTIPQAGKPRANEATGEVVILNRRFFVFDGESGEPHGVLEPWVGEPAEECPGCYYPIGTEITIDARRGLTRTTTYTPRPGKPGAQESIAYDPETGRAYHSLLTGGYVYFSSIGLYADLEALRTREPPLRSLTGLSGRIALDRPARRLYVVRGRTLTVLDSETLYRVGRVDAGTWSPVIAAVDEELGLLYTPRGSRLAVWTRTGGAVPAPLPPETVPVSGTVQDIRPSPNFAADSTLLATIDGQICRSTDGGETWKHLRGGLPELDAYRLAQHAVFSPAYAEDRTLYYGAHLGETHGEGVYRSTDGGETWQHASDGLLDLRVYQIVPSPRYGEDGTLLAYAYIQTGQALYRSRDRGENWALVVRQSEYGTPPIPRPDELFRDFPIHPQYRCNYESLCERSAGGGQPWQPIDTGGFQMGSIRLTALSPTFEDDGTVYWAAQGALYRYHDKSGVGEICTTAPFYGPRDYTNEFRSIAAAADGDGTTVLLLGSAAGEFLRARVEDLNWERVWPRTEDPTPLPPTPSPTPCAQAVDERLTAAAAAVSSKLGCATGPALETPSAIQIFELGVMLWRLDGRRIDVLRQDGTWAGVDDTWEEGQDTHDPGLVPPEGKVQPVRGFGKVWREQLGGPEAWIGWATGEETGGGAVIQPFAGGQLYRAVNGVTYALYTDGTWGSVGKD